MISVHEIQHVHDGPNSWCRARQNRGTIEEQVEKFAAVLTKLNLN